MGFLSGIFKSYSEKEVKRIMPLVDKINGLEDEISKLFIVSLDINTCKVNSDELDLATFIKFLDLCGRGEGEYKITSTIKDIPFFFCIIHSSFLHAKKQSYTHISMCVTLLGCCFCWT